MNSLAFWVITQHMPVVVYQNVSQQLPAYTA